MMSQLSILINMALAMALGGAVGFEREAADKPAGLRTHMLVAGSAALLTSLGNVLVTGIGNNELVRADPIRIVEAVITGVTFLGAGTIIRDREGGEIEGLTTAASLLLVGAIGIGVALEQYLTIIGATVLMLVTLRILKYVSRRVDKNVNDS